MDTPAMLSALAALLLALAALGELVFRFWREMRRTHKKRPPRK